jgi:hypothetical protein
MTEWITIGSIPLTEPMRLWATSMGGQLRTQPIVCWLIQHSYWESGDPAQSRVVPAVADERTGQLCVVDLTYVHHIGVYADRAKPSASEIKRAQDRTQAYFDAREARLIAHQ